MQKEPVVAIIVAAGLGTRYGGPTPKTMLKLTNRAVIYMSVEAMAAGGCTHAVVVVKPDLEGQVRAHLAGSPIPITITTGGANRQQSVHNGLKAVQADPVLGRAGVVLIHDAVRPMVPAYVVEDVINHVRGGAAAVLPAVPVRDTIRMISEDEQSSTVVDRERLRAVQTPQGFALDIVAKAHNHAAGSGEPFTDDASIVEALGHTVVIVPGSHMGMKITEPADFTVAKALWKVRASFGHHSGKRIQRLWKRDR
ncbi:2-C-methyl-D-erythritol 4-phosphate cytidylyltransferase [Propionibacteriaceae bacterium G1746]|uniref:2-C-methyl-D-erythritol 4-phosphate cytidylyltransferase n=1 Tax=Aestuariimicrobium sp. G57 TaxID=3418485 RepID=UPI003C1761DF